MRKFRITVLLLSLITILSFTFYHVEASRVAVIKNITGDVYIKKGGGKKEFKAKEGMSLSQGDSVRTTAKSSANISYEDGSKTTVSSNSKLTISKLKGNNSGKQTKVKVVSGKVWNSVKNLSNTNDEYDVETPTAVMGVRGTHFLVYTDPITGKSTVAVLDGTVGVTQNSDRGSSSSSSSTTNSQPQETLVTVNQTLDTQTVAQPLPEAKTLDVKQLIQQVEPQVIVEMIQDLTQTIKETNEQAKSTQQLYEQTKQQDLIKQAIELSKTASTIANIQDSVLKEINQSTVKTEIERLLETQYNQTLENITKQNNDLKTETRNTEQQVTNAAKNAGLNIPQPQPPTNPGSGVSDSSGNDNTGGNNPATSPVGTPVKIEPGKPITFSNGVSLDFGSHSLAAGTQVTINEISIDQSTLNTKNLTVAGKVIDFSFNPSPTTFPPTTIKLPINMGIDTTKTGVFYRNASGNWEYQHTTISEDGKYAVATVNHFSTYGVLTAEKLEDPTIRYSDGKIIIENLTDLIAKGAKVYYTTNGFKPSPSNGIEYDSAHPPIYQAGSIVFKAISYKENMITGYSELIDTGSISGTIKLPGDIKAPSGGFHVGIVAIPLTASGKPETSPAYNPQQFLTIPKDYNSFKYTIPNVPSGKNYILEYIIFDPDHKFTEFVKSGFYSQAGTVWIENKAEVISVISPDKDIEGKHLQIEEGRIISGTIQLPENINTNYLNLFVEGTIGDGKDFFIHDSLNIPSDHELEISYSITVPINEPGHGYEVVAQSPDGEYQFSPENNEPIDVSNSNQPSTILILDSLVPTDPDPVAGNKPLDMSIDYRVEANLVILKENVADLWSKSDTLSVKANRYTQSDQGKSDITSDIIVDKPLQVFDSEIEFEIQPLPEGGWYIFEVIKDEKVIGSATTHIPYNFDNEIENGVNSYYLTSGINNTITVTSNSSFWGDSDEVVIVETLHSKTIHGLERLSENKFSFNYAPVLDRDNGYAFFDIYKNGELAGTIDMEIVGIETTAEDDNSDGDGYYEETTVGLTPEITITDTKNALFESLDRNSVQLYIVPYEADFGDFITTSPEREITNFNIEGNKIKFTLPSDLGVGTYKFLIKKGEEVIIEAPSYFGSEFTIQSPNNYIPNPYEVELGYSDTTISIDDPYDLWTTADTISIKLNYNDGTPYGKYVEPWDPEITLYEDGLEFNLPPSLEPGRYNFEIQKDEKTIAIAPNTLGYDFFEVISPNINVSTGGIIKPATAIEEIIISSEAWTTGDTLTVDLINSDRSLRETIFTGTPDPYTNELTISLPGLEIGNYYFDIKKSDILIGRSQMFSAETNRDFYYTYPENILAGYAQDITITGDWYDIGESIHDNITVKIIDSNRNTRTIDNIPSSINIISIPTNGMSTGKYKYQIYKSGKMILEKWSDQNYVYYP